MKIACVIPARFKSKRLPGKPLKNILGVPMIIRTAKQCLKVIKRENLFAGAEFQIITTALQYCPDSVPKDVTKKVKKILKNNKK